MTISLDQANAVIAAARAVAVERDERVVLVVVDTARNPVALARTDGAAPTGLEVAQRRACTAVAMGFDTIHTAYSEAGRPRTGDEPLSTDGHGLVRTGGGVVIRAGGAVIGALGVCGATSSIIDHQIGTAGVAALG
ncbi:GlcG/HbpS family heme-binding protein [Nocardia terpenica]|uniref:Heme-binding protein n=1 Tax=Nocardia terpenica TaxID=455432 RepID=A0A291RUT8_9NOCA|nr:heme-binding protein [Nocardia terpenica]ATL71008.1 hypothetical protein CRH09_37370 [Nocardia terpenica]